MCAWMQAGLIVRTAVVYGSVPMVGKFEEWCTSHKVPAGMLRRLADCQAETMVLGHLRATGSLRYEVLVRLGQLKERHERAGRGVPRAAEIESQQSRMLRDGSALASTVPGVAELHRGPDKPIPDGVSDSLAEVWTVASRAKALALTARLSQLFLLRDSELARVREALSSIAEEAQTADFGDLPFQLHTASIVAAAVQDKALADSIGAAVKGIAGRIAQPDDVNWMVHVLMQAAAGHADERAWHEWLAAQLAEVAERLPTEASECKLWLWHLMDSMAVALPIRDWVHLRAKQIAGIALESPQ